MSALFASHEPDPRNRPRPFVGEVRVAATEEDAGAIAAMSVAREGGDLEERCRKLRDELTRIATGASRQLWVAQEDGETIAFARTWCWDRAGAVPPAAGPAGWYLSGVIVDPDHRRRGIANQLTRTRLEWIAERADEAFYFVNEHNAASIDLHRPFGFEEQYRGVWMPGCEFTGGVGVLFRAELTT